MILNITYTVECDKCGDEASFECTTLSDKELHGQLEDENWSHGTNPHGHYMHCPDCTEKEDD